MKISFLTLRNKVNFIIAVGGIITLFALECAASLTASFAIWAKNPTAKIQTGDFNGDGLTDTALVGGTGWATIPIAFSLGNGNFNVTNGGVGDFAIWAQNLTAEIKTGDFNGDGLTDIALVGGTGWATIPIAFSLGNGNFQVRNGGVGDFAIWAQNPTAEIRAGDFNGDRLTDIALVGGTGWATLPIAFSLGNGNFQVRNGGVGDFAIWAQNLTAEMKTGDFNGDGLTDIALVGGTGWATLPIAFSLGNGNFQVRNGGVGDFAIWAQNLTAEIKTGDFNGDGLTDIALVGGTGWATLPIAFSLDNGNFQVRNGGVGDFAIWAQNLTAEIKTGDFNGDGLTDIALVGGTGWATLPIAFSLDNGNFQVRNGGVGDFAIWAQNPTAEIRASDFNRDGLTDIALVGGTGWASLPVAFSQGDGNYIITNSGN